MLFKQNRQLFGTDLDSIFLYNKIMSFQKQNWWNNTFSEVWLFFFPGSTLQSVMKLLVRPMSMTRFLLCKWPLTQVWRASQILKAQFKYSVQETCLMAMNLRSHVQIKTQTRAWGWLILHGYVQTYFSWSGADLSILLAELTLCVLPDYKSCFQRKLR